MTENERLKFLRNHLKFSQSEMAEILGIKQSAYSSIENGVNAITTKQVKILINTYNVNSEWLLEGEGEMLKDTNIKTAISKDNNGNLVQNSKNINIDTCKAEIASLKSLLEAKEEIIKSKDVIIELLTKNN